MSRNLLGGRNGGLGKIGFHDKKETDVTDALNKTDKNLCPLRAYVLPQEADNKFFHPRTQM